MEHLGLRELFVFMLEKPGKDLLQLDIDENFVDYVFLEDNVLRCIRILMAFIGLYFLHNERLNFTRLWILTYLIAFVCSDVIFAFTVAIKNVTWIVFHAITHLIDNIFRIFILYFSFKYAIVHRRTIVKEDG